jgi:membrane-bound inhibitor of C-type lysozyme
MRILSLLALAGLAACSRAAPPQAASDARSAVQATPAADKPGQVNPDPKVTTYACANGRMLVAGYPDADTAVIKWGDHSYTLQRARSADGVRYVGYGLQWWTKGLSEGRIATLKAGEEVASDPGVPCSAAVEPPAPGTPGGLPDDRTPVAEKPFTQASAQGAANVVQTYFALLETGKAAAAAKLRADGRPPDLTPYSEYHAQVGAPGRIEGAAGSLYVEVPVVIYGRLKAGPELHQSGKAVLRRVNDVPGATPEQRRWRIERLELS